MRMPCPGPVGLAREPRRLIAIKAAGRAKVQPTRGDKAMSERIEGRRMPGVEFYDCGMAAAKFDNVNLAGAAFRNVNLEGAALDDVNFKGVRIDNANIEGLTIYGYDIHALIQPLLERDHPHPPGD
jgi:uncharacterized protein YjbI with pentapeptide repeats